MNFNKNNIFLWLTPDSLVIKNLIVSVQEFRKKYKLPEQGYIYHDMIHIMVGEPPTVIGEGCVDAAEQGLRSESFNPQACYREQDVSASLAELLAFYEKGKRLHPVAIRVLYKSGMKLK